MKHRRIIGRIAFGRFHRNVSQKSAIRFLMAFLEPKPVETVTNETIIPSATESLPMKTITRERLFCYLWRTLFFRKIYWKFQNQMNLSVKIKDLVLIMLMILGYKVVALKKTMQIPLQNL